VKLTSNEAQYDPVSILEQLRKNEFYHSNYDMTLVKRTKKILDDLIKIVPKPGDAK